MAEFLILPRSVTFENEATLSQFTEITQLLDDQLTNVGRYSARAIEEAMIYGLSNWRAAQHNLDAFPGEREVTNFSKGEWETIKAFIAKAENFLETIGKLILTMPLTSSRQRKFTRLFKTEKDSQNWIFTLCQEMTEGEIKFKSSINRIVNSTVVVPWIPFPNDWAAQESEVQLEWFYTPENEMNDLAALFDNVF